MSVLAANRRESRFEPIVRAEEIHQMLVELGQHRFSVRDLKQSLRRKYRAGKCGENEYIQSSYLADNARKRLDTLGATLTSYVRAANTIYPTNMEEYNERRSNQNLAINTCEQIIKEIQHIVEVFDVDLNVYDRYVKALYREIELLKKWRQRDNRLKSYFEGDD